MKNYLREQSASQILSSAMELYRQHFALLFLIYLIPTFPFTLWSNYLYETTGEVLNIAYYVSIPFELVPALAIAVAISDICLGNTPSVRRAYARVWRNIVKAFLTWLLFFFGIFVCIALLVIPGTVTDDIPVIVVGTVPLLIPILMFYAVFMLVFVVTIVEQRGPLASFARSKNLGKGFYLRNLGVVLLMWAIIFMLMMLCFALGWGLITLVPALASPWPTSIAQALLTALLVPLVYVGTVLIYYDMRVRKEAYDNTALTEDLMR